MSDIELDDLSRKRQQQSDIIAGDKTEDVITSDSDTVLYWAWGAAILFLVTAIPLLLFPRFLLFLVEGSEAEMRTELTPLESFLSLHVGILLVAIAFALILNVPSIPAIQPQQKTPGHPLLGPLSSACAFTAFISYNTRTVGALGLLLSLGTAIISAWGFWVMMFAGTSSISKKTGADKHTSRFLFGSKAAASSQKKQWKKQQAEAKHR
ncbi:uncharacterized protein LAESUDRAFT_722471 [Laetiporus sulphureus 93-53]|uniref:Uncharacterized protein n=1 Tax=Laetiporus sulphureus 93-53 TaxID=1314785 RepID=A0A165FWK4_9APHY|nr:uncharacterized protein LAESUDRAFT_722471 [Laetiporus sulphureus 93-53]KZT09506.1 hypothetical protein LAESUDRAFT_722471 [Laetiporus sulphureus 93-53]